MLFYGQSYMKNIIAEKTVILSLTSYDESLKRMNFLIPPRELGGYLETDFDIAYGNYILNNNEPFYEFFTIIYNLYCGADVFIAINDDGWSDILIQSLLKLIQIRYGYNGVCIRSMEDYIHAKSYFESDFNKDYGLMNLDMDRNRFAYLMEEYRIRQGQPEIIFDESGNRVILND